MNLLNIYIIFVRKKLRIYFLSDFQACYMLHCHSYSISIFSDGSLGLFLLSEVTHISASIFILLCFHFQPNKEKSNWEPNGSVHLQSQLFHSCWVSPIVYMHRLYLSINSNYYLIFSLSFPFDCNLNETWVHLFSVHMCVLWACLTNHSLYQYVMVKFFSSCVFLGF